MRNLRERSRDAFAWSAIDLSTRQGIQFLISVVLARLLMPRDFGLIGMLMLFIAVAQCLVDSGFGSALIQRQHISEAEKSSVLIVNIAAGILIASLLVLLAPWIAVFYRQPELAPLTRFLSLSALLAGFSSVRTALLTRDLDFRIQMKTGVWATAISGAVAIWMAVHGYGVWSLAVQSVLSSLLSTALIWTFRPWRPALSISIDALRPLFGFGSRLLASSLLNAVFERGQLVVIGKVFSPADLGFYTRAYAMQQMPVEISTSIVSRVLFPVFSSISNDLARLRRATCTAVVAVMALTLPGMVVLSVIARPLVLTLLGPRWLPCVSYFQVFCVAGVFWPLHVINLNVLIALGRSDVMFRLEVVKKILVVVAIAATYRIGLMAMVVGYVVLSVVCYFINSHYVGVFLQYGSFKQLRDLRAYALGAGVMGLAAYIAGELHRTSPLVVLLEQLGVAMVTYVFCCVVLGVGSELKHLTPRFRGV